VEGTGRGGRFERFHPYLFNPSLLLSLVSLRGELIKGNREAEEKKEKSKLLPYFLFSLHLFGGRGEGEGKKGEKRKGFIPPFSAHLLSGNHVLWKGKGRKKRKYERQV